MKHIYTLADFRRWRTMARDIVPVRLGVFGDPVAHSLSPEMQNAALTECGIASRYARFHVRPDELREAIDLVRQLDFVGFNITVPHKVAALQWVDHVDVAAQEIGAVNTVRCDSGVLSGFNTDAPGFGAAVESEFRVSVRGLRVLILGSGGAARAIAHQCHANGCAVVKTWSRSEGYLRAGDVREADFIVNATPVGLSADDAPLVLRNLLRPGQFVHDTIYEPRQTKLLGEAAAAGARFANGLSMLLHQGAASFEIWFNRPAPVEVMRHALASASG